MDARGMRGEDFQALWQRLLRVARLDASAFLEVREDPAATAPAVIVVAVASILSGIGGWLLYTARTSAYVPRGLPSAVASALSPFLPDGTRFFIHSVVVGSALAIALWFAWVFITMLMLQQVWHRQIEFLPLVRTMGLAFFPVGLSVLMVIEALATPIAVISLAAAVLMSGVAVEATVSDAEPSEVLFSNLLGFAVFAIVLGLLGRGGQFYAPGLFAFSS
jgi:hypothetical protein